MIHRKLIQSELDYSIIDLIRRSDHKTLGIWAADCAERVLPYFEKKVPNDNRPRKAIDALRTWVETGIFKMTDVRGYSLAAHAAARSVIGDDVARSAARSAGQAMATAHVKTHSIVAAQYAATAIFYATDSVEKLNKERKWQYDHLVELSKK